MEIQMKIVVERYIRAYQKKLVAEYPTLEIPILEELWSKTSDEGSVPLPSTDVKNKKKRSAYQNYFSMRRTDLRSENKTFGELSKMISREWKEMSTEDKKPFEATPEKKSLLQQNISFDNILHFADEENVDDRSTFEVNESDHENECVDEDDAFIFEGDEDDPLT